MKSSGRHSPLATVRSIFLLINMHDLNTVMLYAHQNTSFKLVAIDRLK